MNPGMEEFYRTHLRTPTSVCHNFGVREDPELQPALAALADAVTAWHQSIETMQQRRREVDEAIFYASVVGGEPRHLVPLVRHPPSAKYPKGRPYTREQLLRIIKAVRDRIMHESGRADPSADDPPGMLCGDVEQVTG